MWPQTRDAQDVERPLDALNFFLADVRDGLGPYLAIYLLTVQKWDEASIGVVMSVAAHRRHHRADARRCADRQDHGQARADDRRRHRRHARFDRRCPFPRFDFVAITQALTGIAGAIFAPAIAAMTLGIVGPKAFARRIGRNEAFNHAGNATAATLAGVIAYMFGPIVVFWLLAAMAAASVFATLSIPR